ncbi:hypothetical protein MKX47_11535 [Solibacillus sp. FSL R7-0668]|uniref:hypothetical protein n=1 Tax=Solibacillus sp. FSL R7-0668 TaxID=2921688 RepID=UPI0030F7E2EA
MKDKKILIALAVLLASVLIYNKMAPFPIKRDLKDGTLLQMHDMNRMSITQYPDMNSYWTTDLQEIKEIDALLMDVMVKVGPIYDEFSRDDEALKVRFSNEESGFAITYTFYENGDLLRLESAMVNKLASYRHVSDKELERVKALVLEGKTLD